ncbi:MAG TPA: TlpA disulfide reductase family protein [Planctomycetota bacterium]|nr:TlpA disulfide reductase family protein [Planctomycetota bacterium]
MMVTISNALLALGLAIAAAQKPAQGPPVPPEPPQAPAAAQGTRVGKVVGMLYPDMELPTVGRDRTVRLSSLRGKPTLVVEFAAGCEGSRRYLEGWHEPSEALRKEGKLQIVGIAQEQHPERAALYAQWKGWRWTILWDPLDVAVAFITPHVYLLDAHGIVRAVDPDPKRLAELLANDYPKPSDLPEPQVALTPALLEEDPEDSEESTAREEHLRAYAKLLWGKPEDIDAAIDVLAADAEKGQVKPAQLFRLGVAYRMRCDSPRARAGDFQAALDAWTAAVRGEPNVQVWRRRLLQYGPREGKPFTFYDWVPQAQEAIRARGEQPIALSVAPSGAEAATGTSHFEVLDAQAKEPDPDGKVERDDAELVSLDIAVTFKPPHTRVLRPDHSARLHIALTPSAERGARWCDSGRPLEIWLQLPEGWRADRRLLTVASDDPPSPSGARWVDVEISPPQAIATSQSGGRGVLAAYALFEVCTGEDSEPVRRRVEFEIPVEVPSMYQ